MQGAIEFDRVTFAYEADDFVLKDLTFKIAPGERVAVVGATGAGKTTPRQPPGPVWDPTRGAVRVDGFDTRAVPLAWLRRGIGVVQQDTLPVRGLGGREREPRPDEIPPAAIQRRGGAGPMPILSFASYRRVTRHRSAKAAARSPVGSDSSSPLRAPSPMIPRSSSLDEATSSVDTETEAAIQAGLEELLTGRTALIIAHRLSTVRSADRILVMHHERAARDRHHEELLASGASTRSSTSSSIGPGAGAPLPDPPGELPGALET